MNVTNIKKMLSHATLSQLDEISLWCQNHQSEVIARYERTAADDLIDGRVLVFDVRSRYSNHPIALFDMPILDPHTFQVVRFIAGVTRVEIFKGRVFRMIPRERRRTVWMANVQWIRAGVRGQANGVLIDRAYLRRMVAKVEYSEKNRRAFWSVPEISDPA